MCGLTHFVYSYSDLCLLISLSTPCRHAILLQLRHMMFEEDKHNHMNNVHESSQLKYVFISTAFTAIMDFPACEQYSDGYNN